MDVIAKRENELIEKLVNLLESRCLMSKCRSWCKGLVGRWAMPTGLDWSMSLSESATESTKSKRIDVKHLDPALDAFVRGSGSCCLPGLRNCWGMSGAGILAFEPPAESWISCLQSAIGSWRGLGNEEDPLDFGHLVVLFEILEVAQLKVAAGLDLTSVSQKFDVIRQVRNAHAPFSLFWLRM